MLIDELHEKKDLILSIAKKYGATDVRVFGSVAKGQENHNSDIDFLISMEKGYDLFKQRLALQEELINLLGKKVDLLVRHELNKYLAQEILSSSKEI